MRAMRSMVLAALVLVAAAEGAKAGIIAFVPPNDPVGTVMSLNSNDGYSDGRGVVFSMQNTLQINSVGIFLDLTNITLSYEIAEVLVTTGDVVAGQTVLRSGSTGVSTNGLEWIDFGIAPLTLTAGNNYHIEFTFAGLGNQNFFYDNNNVAFTQSGFALLDGTQAGNAFNFVMPAIRVNTSDVEVPEPSSIILLGLGTCIARFRARRQRRMAV